ncbi:hypothetical protein GCM10010329_44750 [Streptomyces spiroverticillatus]|uniref:Lecithin:cholesterol acyltransferase n=1 Tax=Streptomyces finlayi TaxID=67296 RepID=A0A918X004_9ACTN|nr:hypothetical protein [Streptomyces finlayi]GHA16802.1 hypothetical protein GCM10010329_44750 [Streptomyces spiroverticillatus]GHC98951.1 hypothetical protein GCM10010334_41930 [Streptomyces finlayi]
MAVRAQLEDLVVVVPGITGSVLERDGHEFWNHSLSALAHATPARKLVRNLRLAPEPGAPDGVRATGLVRGAHLLPGLWGIDGYGPLLSYLRRTFDFSGGNLVEFPYDWRLSNAVNAAALGKVVEGALTRWREASRNPDARVTFVCHSMGGLLARHYLDVLGGSEVTRRLVTIGTPFQGAAKAADVLCRGLAPEARARLGRFGRVLEELTDVVGEFPSLYELLPTYRSVTGADGELRRLGESAAPGVDSARLKGAEDFHRGIGGAPAGYEIVPFGGHLQPTVQSLRVDARGVSPLRSLGGEDVGGDGTVPRFSAAPAGTTSEADIRSSAARHAALASPRSFHLALHGVLTAGDPRRFMAPGEELALDCGGLAAVGAPHPVAVEAREERLVLTVRAEHLESREALPPVPLRNAGEGRYEGALVPDRPGGWRITVEARAGLPVVAVSELVLVVDGS